MPLIMLRMDYEATLLRNAEDWNKTFRQSFGSRLGKLRRVKGWRQRELAQRARIDPGRLSKLERGVVRASVAELVRLSLALGATLDELVFGAAACPEAEWQSLQRDVEKAGGRPALDCAARLLRVLIQGYRTENGAADFTSEGRTV